MTLGKDILRHVLIPIHREGYIFVALFALVSLIVGLLWEPLWIAGIILTLWCVWFFRDPERTTPTRSGLVVAPADGLIQSVRREVPPPEMELGSAPLPRISIFMSVFNVHVNRIPADGEIVKQHYRPGAFLNASLDKASDQNERMCYVLETPAGDRIGFVQIAGLIARRILRQVETGDDVRAGQRFGMIRFGSRMDVYLPENAVPLVCEGQTALAGETILADLDTGRHGNDGPMRGEVR